MNLAPYLKAENVTSQEFAPKSSPDKAYQTQ